MPASGGSTGNVAASGDHAKKEAERYSNLYHTLIAMHEALEEVADPSLRRRLRELVNRVEDDLIFDPDFEVPRNAVYNQIRLGVLGGSLSGKSGLVSRFMTDAVPAEDPPPVRHKKHVIIDGQSQLLLLRDETGPPDAQFSTWLDGVLLVFNMEDELSFNVISSYYAKMLPYRAERELPCVLVAVRDKTLSDNINSVDLGRVKKFVADHKQCPFFVATLETGEHVSDVFYAAAEKILQSQHATSIHLYDSLLAGNAKFSSMTSIDGAMNVAASSAPTLTGSLKKQKRRNTLFSSKSEKKDEPVADDIGSGRSIPVKQGYLYKRSHSSLKEWKKKYVILTEDGKFAYYSSMKDYMEDNHSKSLRLIHSTVKCAGRRQQRSSLSSQNSIASSRATVAHAGDSPRKPLLDLSRLSPVRTLPMDCYVISNVSVNGHRPDASESGSPTLMSGTLERAPSESVSRGLRATNAHDLIPARRKHKRVHRHAKSCEIDYRPDAVCAAGDGSDVIAPPVGTPSISRKKSTLHRRQKSVTGTNKDLSAGDKFSDAEDDDLVFTVVTLDGRSWDFETGSVEERDGWIQAIENEILRAFSTSLSVNLNGKCSSECGSPVGPCVKATLSAVAGNDRCADCGAPDPDWASLNLGVVLCIECSGVHRNLGSHLSRVRSLYLDDWPVEYIQLMLALGNTFANSLWEENVGDTKKPMPNANREERELWINRKYEKKEFLRPVGLSKSSMTQDLVNGVRLNDLQRLYSLLLSSRPSDINATTDVAGQKMAALHVACADANLAVTQMLLWFDANPAVLDGFGYNPIHYANRSSSKECADLLCQFGCPEDTPC